MTGVAAYLDTNIIITIMEGPVSDDTGIQRFWREAGEYPGVSFHTSELSFAELLVSPYRDRNRPLVDDYVRLFEKKDVITIHPVTRAILDVATVIRSGRKMKLPDAIHLATASSVNCSHLLTFDRGFADLEETIHPLYEEVRLSPVKVVRPDPASLSKFAQALQ